MHIYREWNTAREIDFLILLPLTIDDREIFCGFYAIVQVNINLITNVFKYRLYNTKYL